ncbi:MAG: threonine--tRNA ligase, partial [Bacteroidaceae bacterium]|nr:threonine--tRNA ligase [Bacteroidaceae bacterium]
MIKIALPQGAVHEFGAENLGKSFIELVSSIDPKILNTVVAARVDGAIIDLRDVPADGCEVQLVSIEEKDALHVLRHTATHIMAEAVKHLFPDAKVTIGPATENGFFYDFDCPPFTKENLDAIEKEMKKIIKSNPRIERKVISREEAIELMKQKGEPYKLELIDAIPEGERITIYTQDDFVDLCMGPH